MSNLEAQERDRLKRQADDGVCPICGRQSNQDIEKRLREYARINSELHAKLANLEIE